MTTVAEKIRRRGTIADALPGVARRAVRETPAKTIALVSHADPLQAAWILLDGRAHNEVEMYRRAGDRAGVLKVEFENGDPASWEYQPPPKVDPVRKAS